MKWMLFRDGAVENEVWCFFNNTRVLDVVPPYKNMDNPDLTETDFCVLHKAVDSKARTLKFWGKTWIIVAKGKGGDDDN